MKKINILTLGLFLLGIFSCKQQDFIEAYPNPGKLSSTSVERQFTGFLYTNKDYVLPAYRNYFVTLRTTLNHYVQTTGWANETGQYVPGSSGAEDIWYNYYSTLAQYRELEKIYNAQDATSQKDRKVYMLAAKVYLYDYTQRMVDVFGAMPFTDAGKISQNEGDYTISLAKFDSADAIYTMMLDELKTVATELNGITLNSTFQLAFKTQDYVNQGSIDLWKRYCNSIRLRMLNRVSASANLSARAKTEMGEILGNSATFPIVENLAQNIQINVYDLSSNINSKGFQGALESGTGWFINTAGKKMIDQLVSTKDPRLAYIFQPGSSADGQYLGIDPMASSSEQTELANTGKIAIYNTSTYARNQYIPGTLINAAEVNLIKAEYYLKNGNDALAKENYNASISNSVAQYVKIRSVSNDNSVAAPSEPTSTEIADYASQDAVSWEKATNEAEKIKLIATQKWIHYNILQAYENWAEQRRLDALSFNFVTDNANNQTLPPYRFNIPGNEITYNKANYSIIQDQDKLGNKIFWDIK
ncbi:SusD/RagB family nutrient-binding outer membrane lipoprotein [Lacihabitans sp. LS3-19]|uniref:SusD/RagB family nutrient-binding outer membrane lipoprotein n=1 Tax=Lacihabitans sp. LS3-19 TaxID=2487335 RepID=UPI0020CF5AC9|nr:SusD/RagB family nutrient-binding outer membrane lipoprotein [Lacihabitans sp. LS3-19]